MARLPRSISYSIVVAFLATPVLVPGAWGAPPPALIQYQGKLLDGAAAPVPDADYPMEFRFYDACTDGTLLLTDTHAAVPTRDGLYAVVLGGGMLTPGAESDLAAVFSGHEFVCLGVTVAADSEMVPRQRITSSAYALHAGSALSALTAVTAENAVGAVGVDDDPVWTGTHTFESDIEVDGDSSLTWLHATGNPPPAAKFRLTKFIGQPPGQAAHPNGEGDEQFMFCYNCESGGTSRDDDTQHAFNFKFEQTYFDGAREILEHNWNYESPTGFRWRPFAFRLFVSGLCSDDGSLCYDDADCAAGTCDSMNEADLVWKARPGGRCSEDLLSVCLADADCPVGVCQVDAAVKFDTSGRLTGFGGIDVKAIRAGDVSTLNPNGVQVLVDAAPADAAGVVRGVQLYVDYHEDAAPGSSLTSLTGLESQVELGGGGSGRTVTSEVAAVQAITKASATGGSGNFIQRMSGLRAKAFLTGDAGLSVGQVAGVRVVRPASGGTVDVGESYGVFIEDQDAIGSVRDAAIYIAPQSGDGDSGNLWMAGGAAFDGHLRLGDGHLWVDPAGGTLRYAAAAPTSNSDGTPVHAPPGTNANWGGLLWGDTTSADHDTGTEVCALAGMTCLETYDMGAATSRSCGTPQHATPRFMALCY